MEYRVRNPGANKHVPSLASRLGTSVTSTNQSASGSSTQAGQRPERKPKPPPPNYPKYSWRTPLSKEAPIRTFNYVTNMEDAEYFLGQLQGDIIGFDAEWKPNYVKGEAENPISLVQLADTSSVVLVHISQMRWKVPNTLRAILQNPNVLKAGVGISGDMDKIKRDLGITILGCLELSTLARAVDPTPWAEHSGKLISLAKLTEVYVRNILDKPKRLQRGNWEQRLQPPMQEYAANDAAAGLSIYLALQHIQKTDEQSSTFSFAAPSTSGGSASTVITNGALSRFDTPAGNSEDDSSGEVTATSSAVTMSTSTLVANDEPPIALNTLITRHHGNTAPSGVKVTPRLLDRLNPPSSSSPASVSTNTDPKRRRRKRVKTMEGETSGPSLSRLAMSGRSQDAPRPAKRVRD